MRKRGVLVLVLDWSCDCEVDFSEIRVCVFSVCVREREREERGGEVSVNHVGTRQYQQTFLFLFSLFFPNKKGYKKLWSTFILRKFSNIVPKFWDQSHFNF